MIKTFLRWLCQSDLAIVQSHFRQSWACETVLARPCPLPVRARVTSGSINIRKTGIDYEYPQFLIVTICICIRVVFDGTFLFVADDLHPIGELFEPLFELSFCKHVMAA